MKLLLFNIICVLFGFMQSTDLAITANNLSDDTFKLVKTDKDISYYERWLKDEEENLLREVKLELLVKAEIDEVVNIIKDESLAVRWNSSVDQCSIVDQFDSAWVTYYRYAIPWPLSNQDCVLLHEVEKQNNNAQEAVIINFKSIEHKDFEKIQGIKRLDDILGRWEILQTSNDKVILRYFIRTAPNSSFPKWLSDPIIRNNLITSLANFRTIAEQEVR